MNNHIQKWKPIFPRDKYRYLNFSMCIIAKRGSGKSYLIQYLYKNYLRFNFHLVYIFSPTIHEYEYIQNSIKYMYFVPSIFDDIDYTNAIRQQQHKKPINVLFIFDDTNNRKQIYSKKLADIFMRGRHTNISIIYTSQSAKFIASEWKDNIDILSIFQPSNSRQRQYIINEFVTEFVPNNTDLSIKDEFDEANKIIKKITNKEYTCLILEDIIKIEHGKKRKKKRLYWFKAD